MWNLTPLTNRLKIEGYNVHLETSGISTFWKL